MLHSELRSKQRLKYDSDKKKRYHMLELDNLHRRAIREESEAKEIADLRRTLVHKAQPIAHYAPTIIKPSGRPCTQPISPHFETDKVRNRKYHWQFWRKTTTAALVVLLVLWLWVLYYILHVYCYCRLFFMYRSSPFVLLCCFFCFCFYCFIDTKFAVGVCIIHYTSGLYMYWVT